MTALDLALLEWVAGHRVPWVTQLSLHVMDAGLSRRRLLVIGLGISVLALVLRQWRAPVAAALAAELAILADGPLKTLFGVDRPPDALALVSPESLSFPSTHAAGTMAAAIGCYVALRCGRRWPRLVVGWALGAFVVGVAAMMVYLGAHWLTDVLAGWVVGGVLGYVVGRLVQRLGPRPASTAAPAARA